MAGGTNTRTFDDVRRDLESEREQLADAADSLRKSVSKATDISARLRANLPAVAAAAIVVGFLVAGGAGATTRLIFGRESETKGKLGRFRLVDRN
jgi:hypothetical protein